MNILQILPELNVGGVETGTLDLAKYLVKLGHKSVVVSNGGTLVKELESFGAFHYSLPVHKKSLFSMIRTVGRLVEIIKKENIEIIHARSRVPAWIAYLAARKTNRVFITTCHGYYKRHVFTFVMGWAKIVICPSNVIARHMINDFKVPHERIRLIPRSVDLDKFKFISPDIKRKTDFNVGIVGRITPLKGHSYFIKAMARLKSRIHNLKIWIIGDVPGSKEAYKEELQILVKRLGIASCTQFLGTQRDIPAVMESLDLLVMPTIAQEAFGRVIIEAQAAGVPVVATKVGGVVDIIEDEVTGLLVPPADPKALTEASYRIFENKEFAAKMSKAAYKKVNDCYGVELMVKRTLAVYNEALSRRKILIIKLSSLGDVILSSAAIRTIRECTLKTYSVSVLVGNDAKDVLLNCPYIDELLVCDPKNKDKGIWGIWKLGRFLREKYFDVCIDFQNNRYSHMLSYLTLAPDRYGYDNGKLSFLLNKKIKDEKKLVDPVTHQFETLKMLNIPLKDPQLELWPTESESRYIEEFLNSQWLSENQRLVGINISASLRWQSKNWPIDNLVKLCLLLSQKKISVVVTGTTQDIPIAEEVSRALKDIKIINACGKTSVNQLACLIKKCSVYISADSAPLHIACAMKTPFIALFGPTDPRRHLVPFRNSILIKKDLPCSCCYKPKCKTKECMSLITPEEVYEAVEKLIR